MRVWVVVAGAQVFARASRGPSSRWYRGTGVARFGAIELGEGLAQRRYNVRLATAPTQPTSDLDAVCRAKFGRYACAGSILTSEAIAASLRLDRIADTA